MITLGACSAPPLQAQPRRSASRRPAPRLVVVRANDEPPSAREQGPESPKRQGSGKRVTNEDLAGALQQFEAHFKERMQELNEVMEAQRQSEKELAQRSRTSADELSAQIAAHAAAVHANTVSLARLSFAPALQGTLQGRQGSWPQGVVRTGEDLVDLVSCPGWPADLAPVLSKVLEGHCGYSALRRLLLPELAHLAPAVEALLPRFEPVPPASDAAWWKDEQGRMREVAAAVDEQRQGGGTTVPLRLLPFLSMLGDYCAAAAEAAAAPGNASGCLHRFLLQEREDACAPVVTLVAALAAGKLRTSLVMCCKARLAVQGGAARIETMETRRPGRKGLLKARRRLQVTGRVAVWLLHVANPALAAAAPLHLRGVLASQRMSEEERRTWHEWERWGGVDAGCPGLGAGAASATMQLHLHLF